MLSRQTSKTFLLSWFNFAWFFVSVIAVMNDDLQRSFTNWLIRGVIGGFFAGLISAYLDQRRRAKEVADALPNAIREFSRKGVDA
jgi:hypothetical protein